MLVFIGILQSGQSHSSLSGQLGSHDALHIALSSTFIFSSPDSMFLFYFPIRSLGQTDVNSTFMKGVIVFGHTEPGPMVLTGGLISSRIKNP